MPKKVLREGDAAAWHEHRTGNLDSSLADKTGDGAEPGVKGIPAPLGPWRVPLLVLGHSSVIPAWKDSETQKFLQDTNTDTKKGKAMDKWV